MKANHSLDCLLELISTIFDAHSAVLFLPEGAAVRLHGGICRQQALDPDALIEPGKGLVGWIAKRAEPLLINSMEQSQPYLGYYPQDGSPEIGSFMGCPVPDGGVLCVDSLKLNAFSALSPQLLHEFAQLIPMLLQAAQSLETEIFFKVLQQLQHIRNHHKGWQGYLSHTLPLLAQATGFSYAAFVSLAEEGTHYHLEAEYPPMLIKPGAEVNVPVDNGMAGWVLRHEQQVSNEREGGSVSLFGKIKGVPDFATALCVPVFLEKNVCGALCLASPENRRISEDLRSFVHLVAEDMSRLLEVLQLRYKLRALAQGMRPQGS